MTEQKKKLTLKCPTCRESTPWHDNPFRPFCSERCKMIDLGNWAAGSYQIETVDPPDFSDDGPNGSQPSG